MEDGNGKDTYNRKLKPKINDIANYTKYSLYSVLYDYYSIILNY